MKKVKNAFRILRDRNRGIFVGVWVKNAYETQDSKIWMCKKGSSTEFIDKATGHLINSFTSPLSKAWDVWEKSDMKYKYENFINTLTYLKVVREVQKMNMDDFITEEEFYDTIRNANNI